MSVICDVLVYSTVRADRAAAAVRIEGGNLAYLPVVQAGGQKAFCGYVYAAALNYITPGDIEAAIAAAVWPDPDHTIVVMDPYDYDIPPYATTVTAIRLDLEMAQEGSSDA